MFATLVSTDNVCVVPDPTTVDPIPVADLNVKNILLVVESVLIPESLIVVSFTLYA